MYRRIWYTNRTLVYKFDEYLAPLYWEYSIEEDKLARTALANHNEPTIALNVILSACKRPLTSDNIIIKSGKNLFDLQNNNAIDCSLHIHPSYVVYPHHEDT